MQPLPLRPEDPPATASVIIRAGVMERESIKHSAAQCFEGYGVHGISVEVAIAQDLREACAGSSRLRRYRQVRLSTVGRLHLEGFPLLASFDWPHFTVVLPDLTDLTLARLEHSFDPPIPNPGR